MKSTKRSIVALAVVSVLSAAVLIVAYTNHVLDAKPGGGFTRNIVTNVLTDSVIMALPFNSYYIAGHTHSTIYLGNETAPLQLLSLTDRKLGNASICSSGPIPRVSRIVVDSPFFYLQDLEKYTIRAGSLTTLKVEHPAVQGTFFSEAIPLSPNSVIQRTISDRAKEYTLSKLTPRGHTYQHNLLQKQVDGFFCTDGMLTHNRAKHRFTYVYFYRNEFICTDTSLNLEFRHKTIDTISRARIGVAKLATEDAMILSTPPFVVNRRSATFADALFINSLIIGDSESNDVTRNNSIIDVYDLENEGVYLYSFYLPHFLRHPMKQFTVHGNNLFSIHDRFLVRYRLRRV